MSFWPFSQRRKSTQRYTKVIKSPTVEGQNEFQRRRATEGLPQFQSALLLREIRRPYDYTCNHPIPRLQKEHEVLVRVLAVGLNPIDWKAPDYNFGIPILPYISGRELVGSVIRAPSSSSAQRIRRDDIVIIPSTDYRDLRKAAFQEYSIASSFNCIRVPNNISVESGSIAGVAFVAAVLALGICMGVDFSTIENGPDLLSIVKSIDRNLIPADIRKECLEGIRDEERAQVDDFIVIWGGNSTCAHTAKQLARLVGLRIISVVDTAKHGLRLSTHTSIRPDLLVDGHDPERAISVIREATKGTARFGFDTLGKDTAAHLVRALSTSQPTLDLPKELRAYDGTKDRLPTPPATPSNTSSKARRAHLVGLTGLPKTDIPEDTLLHGVPIKLFHEIPEIGEACSAWCERLLAKGLLAPPEIVGTVEGLQGINDGLDRMRRREISGGRLVAVLR